MSAVLGLSVAKDTAVTDAIENRDVAKAAAEDGLIDGVVDAVVGWMNGTSDARTVYNVAVIGLTAARGVAIRTAVGAFEVADINRWLDESTETRSTNSAAALALARSERDAVLNAPESEWPSQAPNAPLAWYGNPISPEQAAASRAAEYQATMDDWGVTALRTWIAEVDSSGVLNSTSQSLANPGPDGSNPTNSGNDPGSPGNNPQPEAGTGSQSDTANSPPGGPTTAPPPGDNGPSPQDAWDQALQSARNSLNTAGNVDSPLIDSMNPDSPNYGFAPEQEFLVPIRRPGVLGEMDELAEIFGPITASLRGRRIEVSVTGGPLSNYVSTPYANASLVDKFSATFLYAVENGLFPSEMQAQVEELAQPENLAIMTAMIGGTLGLFAGLQATPLNWAVDGLALGLGAVGFGSAAVNIGDSLYTISQIETEVDRRDAARQLARQMNSATIDALLGLVGGNGGKIADKAKDGLEVVGRVRGIEVDPSGSTLGSNGGNIRIKLAPKANTAIDDLNQAADNAIDAAATKAEDAATKVVDASKASPGAVKINTLNGRIPDVAPNSKFRGGKHGDTKFPRGDGLDSNHSPADAISPFRRDDGPAFQMDPRDHRRMSSTGSSKEAKAWRQKQKDLIAQGKLREAVQMDIDEARRLFPGKYDDAIQEMLDYITSIGY